MYRVNGHSNCFFSFSLTISEVRPRTPPTTSTTPPTTTTTSLVRIYKGGNIHHHGSNSRPKKPEYSGDRLPPDGILNGRPSANRNSGYGSAGGGYGSTPGARPSGQLGAGGSLSGITIVCCGQLGHLIDQASASGSKPVWPSGTSLGS